MAALVIVILIIINIFTVYRMIFNMIFRDSDDLAESIRYSMIPDIISLFRGEYIKDRMAELKLGIFILACLVVTIIEYSIIDYFIRWIMD